MPTSNPKISAYVPQDLYDQFIDFKEQRGLSSASQAVIVILTEFFSCNAPGRSLSSSPDVSLEAFQELSQRVDNLSKMLELTTSLSAQLPDQESPTKQLPLLTQDSGIKQNNSDLKSGLSDELEVEQASKKPIEGLSGRSLATRLNCHNTTVFGKLKKGHSAFSSWAKDLDPEGISWAYDSETKKFFPISEP